jgi:putative FmdB family regulatory protein
VPIYEYRCSNGHVFEVMQSMSDDPVTKCRECGAPVERVFHPVAVHFKGSGFYTTDYGRNRGAAAESKAKEADSKAKDKETAGSKSDTTSSGSDSSSSSGSDSTASSGSSAKSGSSGSKD